MNDADIEQAAFESTAKHEGHLKKRGICTHGAADGSSPCICRYCQKSFATFEALLEERRDLLS